MIEELFPGGARGAGRSGGGIISSQSAQRLRFARVQRLNSAAGTRTRVTRVRAEYPNQLDYGGFAGASNRVHILYRMAHMEGNSQMSNRWRALYFTLAAWRDGDR